MRINSSSKRFYWAILVLSVSFAIMSSSRFTWFFAVNYDEGIYLLTSRLFSQGVVLYKEIVPVTKPPLIFMINAVLIRVFGSSLLLARFFILAISVLSAFLIYLITDCLVKDPRIALLASILFSVFSSLPLSEIFWMMTEPYVILFELGALYFLTKFRLTGDTRNLVLSGVLSSSALLARQTAGLFLFLCFLLFAYWRFKGYFPNKRIFSNNLLGIALPIILVVLLFGYLGALKAMIDQTTAWAGSDVLLVTVFTWLRQRWFFEYLVFSSPLWFMAALSLVLHRNLKRGISDYAFVFFLFFWAVTVVAFYKLVFGPGYHHEYSETLAPLSILSSLGISSVSGILRETARKKNNSYFRRIRKLKGLRIFLIVAPLVLLCLNSFTYNLNFGEVFTNDFQTIEEVSSYIKNNTRATDKLLVFETQHAKIGSLIYSESGRNPIWLKRGFNCLIVTNEERDELVELLRNDENVRILLIGGRPSKQFQNGNYMYDFIVGNYAIEKEFEPYTPYPGSTENLPITLLRDLRVVSYSVMLELSLSDFKGASFKIENGILTLSEEFAPGLTLYYPFGSPVDLSSAILSMQVVGENKTNTLYVDLVDEEGNFMRHKITYSSDWDEIRVPINHLTFSPVKNLTDAQNVKQLNLILTAESEINLSIRGMCLFQIHG